MKIIELMKIMIMKKRIYNILFLLIKLLINNMKKNNFNIFKLMDIKTIYIKFYIFIGSLLNLYILKN